MSTAQWVVITDLDGTLLDQKTYACDASLPAVRRLRSQKIPVILCSTKTRQEMQTIWRKLSLRDPFIYESGGAVFLPHHYFSFPVVGAKFNGFSNILELGADIFRLRQALVEAARTCGVKVKSFGTMSLREIIALTGLTSEQALHARKREYDEPFFVESGDQKTLFAALHAKGLTITKGDRFHHLTGGHGKGEAVKALLQLYQREYGSIISIGLGNSDNDLPFLLEVDRPVLVRNSDGSWAPEVIAQIPGISLTESIGPQGWAEAIAAIVPENASSS